MNLENMKKNPVCPKCTSENITCIVYGLPFTTEFPPKHDRKISYGGCCITDKSPKWQCQDCENRWGFYIKRDE